MCVTSRLHYDWQTDFNWLPTKYISRCLARTCFDEDNDEGEHSFTVHCVCITSYVQKINSWEKRSVYVQFYGKHAILTCTWVLTDERFWETCWFTRILRNSPSTWRCNFYTHKVVRIWIGIKLFRYQSDELWALIHYRTYFVQLTYFCSHFWYSSNLSTSMRALKNFFCRFFLS